jgi:hypothetical protein
LVKYVNWCDKEQRRQFNAYQVDNGKIEDELLSGEYGVKRYEFGGTFGFCMKEQDPRSIGWKVNQAGSDVASCADKTGTVSSISLVVGAPRAGKGQLMANKALAIATMCRQNGKTCNIVVFAPPGTDPAPFPEKSVVRVANGKELDAEIALVKRDTLSSFSPTWERCSRRQPPPHAVCRLS